MWTKFAIIAMLIVLFICTVYFSSSKRKEKLFLKYNKSFGKEPQNYNKEANIEFLKDFYKARKENENEEPQLVENVVIDLQKQRAGGLAKVTVRFDKKVSEFRNLIRR